MRILHILDHSVPVQSGYSYRTLEILREQVAAGFDVLALTGPKQPSAHGSRELVEGWEFVRTRPPGSLSWAPKIVREHAILRAVAQRLKDAAREWRPTILHAHSPVINGLAALTVGAELGVPVVYEVRALWEDALTSHGIMKHGRADYALARCLETYVIRHSDAVVTISRGLHGELCARGVRDEDIFVVPNAVDVARFAPEAVADAMRDAPSRDPVVGFIGSFYSYEGLDLLLEAASRIIAHRRDVRFMLVGGGREETRLRHLRASSNMSNYVKLTGWIPRDRIVDSYRQIDIFVYPRRRNRLTELVTPLKPLEAMAMAKVVLASDVGGHQELIEDGRTGFLFKAESVPDLVVRLTDLLDASHTWPVIGATARRFIEEERTWKAVAATYAQVYDRARSRSCHAARRKRR